MRGGALRFARAMLVAGPLLAVTPGAGRTGSPDPLQPLLSRMDVFLHRAESEGVTLDPRRLVDLPEQIRLSVVPQLLGYCDLYAVSGRPEHREDIVVRAEFLRRGLDALRSGDASDGMLAYALQRASEVTGNPGYRDAARPIVDACLALDSSQLRLNRGLMAALALANHARSEGDPAARDKARSVVELAAREQHADGSFPHTCAAGSDVHYTAWMAVELSLLGELLDDPAIDSALTRARAFLRGRVGADGIPGYEETVSGTTVYYYSKAACPADYETRGWTNELAYHALLFDRWQDARYQAVLTRLLLVEDRGGLADKWGYEPDAGDPYYAWSSEPRSVIRTSLAFWPLASILADRERGQRAGPTPGARPAIARSEEPDEPRAGLEVTRGGPGIGIAFSLSRPAVVDLAIHDLQGRRVATLLRAAAPAGRTALRWDGAGPHGRRSPRGIYFARLTSEGRSFARPVALLD